MDPLFAAFISQPPGDVAGISDTAVEILHKQNAEPAWLGEVSPASAPAALEKCCRALMPICSRSSATGATAHFELIEKLLLVIAVLVECPVTLPMLVDERLEAGRFVDTVLLGHVQNIVLDPAPEIDKLSTFAASHLLKVIREFARTAPPELAASALSPPLLHFAAHSLAMFGGEDARSHEGLRKAIEARNAIVNCRSSAVRAGFFAALTRVARESVFTAGGAAAVLDAFVCALAAPPPDSLTAEGVLDILRAVHGLAASFASCQEVQVLYFWSVANALCDASRPLTRATRSAFAAAAPLWRGICAAVAAATRRWPSSRLVLMQGSRALMFNVTTARCMGYLGALAAIEAGVLTAVAAALSLHAHDPPALQPALNLLVELTRSRRAVADLPSELLAGLCGLLERYMVPGAKLPPDSLVALMGSIISHYRAHDSTAAAAGNDHHHDHHDGGLPVPPGSPSPSRPEVLARPLELLEAVMARLADAEAGAGASDDAGPGAGAVPEAVAAATHGAGGDVHSDVAR